MIIYNITTQVSWTIDDRWKTWLINEHLPLILSTGMFSHHQLVRVLETDDEFGPTYALQLYLHENRSINEYKTKHLPAFEKQQKILWGNNAYSFSSLMEVIN